MLSGKIEAILFAAAKPVEVKTLGTLLEVSHEVLSEAIEELKTRRNTEDSGVHVIAHDGKLQLVSNPGFTEVVKGFVKEDVGGELTRPSLETLTIIAYRGPVTKPEIEQIRGVNCSLILRNLLMRGLIEERDDAERFQPVYTMSTDMLRQLGLHGVEELPSYGEFHGNERIDKMLAELSAGSIESGQA